MTSKEKITSAQTSKNLQEVPPDELGDIDIIRACGMAGQSNPLGLSIWRWRYAGDQAEMAKIAVGLVDRGHEAHVVFRVLKHLVNDVCPACLGRGFGTMQNAPVLTDDLCVDCQGTGRKTIEGEREQALIEVIMGLERDVAGKIMQKLARNFEF
jgi:hypothetical protein